MGMSKTRTYPCINIHMPWEGNPPGIKYFSRKSIPDHHVIPMSDVPTSIASYLIGCLLWIETHGTWDVTL